MRPLFFSFRVRFHRRGASVGKRGGLRGEMPAVHARHVAEREHHGVEAALHRGGVGDRVVLQLHHFRRDLVPRSVRRAGVEAAVLSVQRTRRVSERFTCAWFVLPLHNCRSARRCAGRRANGSNASNVRGVLEESVTCAMLCG